MDKVSQCLSDLTKTLESFSDSVEELSEELSGIDEWRDIEYDKKPDTPYKPKTKPMDFRRKKPWGLFYRRS